QDLVGLLDLLELLLGLLVAGIAIGMQLHGEAPVGLLDVGLRRIARHAQDRVVVALRHASRISPRSRGASSLAVLVLHFLEFGIDDVVVLALAAGSARRAGVRRGAATLPRLR